MNIGIVTAWYPAGAGYVSKQYEATLAREHNVFIYARGQKAARGDPAWERANVTWAPRHPESGSAMWKSHFLRWLHEKKIETIIFNEQRYWLAVIWAKDAHVKCGAYVDYYTQDTVPFFALYDFLVCNTKRHYSVFSWHPQCVFVPWGVMPESLRKPIRASKAGPVVFIASAGWQPKWNGDRRGTLLALKAFKDVKGDCRFRVYSQASKSEMTKEWLSAIEADNRIELLVGTFSPFPYEEGDVYVYPSRLDGIGLTLPEALASGLAAIATDCAPMNEFVRQEENGLVVPVEKYLGRQDGYYWAVSLVSQVGLTEAMQRFVDQPDFLRRMKNGAACLAERELNWLDNSSKLSTAVSKFRMIPADANLIRTVNNYRNSNPVTAFRHSVVQLITWLRLWFFAEFSCIIRGS